MTQLNKLRKILRKKGDTISNIYAVRNLYILRLSERIRELEAGGWKFKKYFCNFISGKEYIYEVLSKPKLCKNIPSKK